MKAVRIHAYGGPSVLRIDEVEVPSPAADEVLVRVVASSVNPIEWKIRSGAMARATGRPLPVTLGWDCAGVVAAVGTEVAGLKPGDAVFSYPEFGAGGTHAEFVAIKAAQVALKPRTVSFVDAAALPMTGGAAWQCIAALGEVRPGQRVLIHGGAGGVGSLAIQIAKARGAHVIATASEPNLGLVEALGANEVIDHRATRFEQVAHNIDLVVDLVGGETQERSWGVLRPGGLLVATAAPPSPERAQAAGVRAAFVFTPPLAQTLTSLAEMVDAMRLRPVIGLELGLAEARRAHEMGEAGRVTGKIVLHVGAP